MKITGYSNFTNKFFLFLIFLIIIFPKINIIPLSDYLHQGIRSDDLIVLVYLLYLIINFENLVIKKNSIAIKFLYFFPFFIFSIFNGFLNNINQYWLFLPRFIEYIFLIFLLENFINNKNTPIKICKYVIYLNFIFVLLQVNEIVGGFTTVRYYEAGSSFLTRPFGLTGGSWEVGAILSICFIIIYQFSDKKNSIENFILLGMVIFTLYLCQTRGTIFAFVLTLFFLLKSKKIKISLIIILFLSIFFIFPTNEFLNGLLKLELSFILNSFIFFLQNGYATEEMFDYAYYYSLGLRLDHIGPSYLKWKDDLSTILFGIGFEKIYMDSFYLRSLISFGLVGSLIILSLSLIYLPFIILIFLGISGLTLDHIFSFKIFTLVILYIHLIKLCKNEK